MGAVRRCGRALGWRRSHVPLPAAGDAPLRTRHPDGGHRARPGGTWPPRHRAHGSKVRRHGPHRRLGLPAAARRGRLRRRPAGRLAARASTAPRGRGGPARHPGTLRPPAAGPARGVAAGPGRALLRRRGLRGGIPGRAAAAERPGRPAVAGGGGLGHPAGPEQRRLRTLRCRLAAGPHRARPEPELDHQHGPALRPAPPRPGRTAGGAALGGRTRARRQLLRPGDPFRPHLPAGDPGDRVPPAGDAVDGAVRRSVAAARRPRRSTGPAGPVAPTACPRGGGTWTVGGPSSTSPRGRWPTAT